MPDFIAIPQSTHERDRDPQPVKFTADDVGHAKEKVIGHLDCSLSWKIVSNEEAVKLANRILALQE